MNVDSVIIPGGCTKYIQASDVSWNKPFKTRIKDLCDQWLSEGVHQFTESGNMYPLSRKRAIEWVLKTPGLNWLRKTLQNRLSVVV